MALTGASASFALTDKVVDFRRVFATPLISGASVSADYYAKSPGKELALRYTDAAKIETVAVGGRPGVEMIKKLQGRDWKDRSIVLAVDFFFWDSTLASPRESLTALTSLVDLARNLHVPLVLGEIPALLPAGYQPTRNKLNEAIRRECDRYDKCVVMPFDRIHQEILKTGSWTFKGKTLKLKQIIPDGLHLSPAASQMLADLLHDRLANTSSE